MEFFGRAAWENPLAKQKGLRPLCRFQHVGVSCFSNSNRFPKNWSLDLVSDKNGFQSFWEVHLRHNQSPILKWSGRRTMLQE